MKGMNIHNEKNQLGSTSESTNRQQTVLSLTPLVLDAHFRDKGLVNKRRSLFAYVKWENFHSRVEIRQLLELRLLTPPDVTHAHEIPPEVPPSEPEERPVRLSRSYCKNKSGE